MPSGKKDWKNEQYVSRALSLNLGRLFFNQGIQFAF